MSEDLSRDQLVSIAVKLGISPDKVARTTTYLLQEKINKKQKKLKKKKKKSKRQQFNYGDGHESVDETVHAEAVFDDDGDFDDTKTLCDMSSFTQHKSPLAQKFARFKELQEIRKRLLDDIATNSQVLNTEDLEPDSSMVIQNKIAEQQEMLQSTVVDMNKINQWFIEIAAENKYNDISRKVRDSSGELQKHFSRKSQNLTGYLEMISSELKM